MFSLSLSCPMRDALGRGDRSLRNTKSRRNEPVRTLSSLPGVPGESGFLLVSPSASLDRTARWEPPRAPPLEPWVYLSIPPPRPHRSALLRGATKATRLRPDGRPPRASTVRLGVRGQEIEGDLEAGKPEIGPELCLLPSTA